ncbi:hypothetical protein DFJ63DRAFT_337684 [Scheffersomyces coipomensis]|uniref:uncharacterized protein n=1 Tax=Scheffersomyces coipomensis TaxID=1788519 RepID=UPI00315D8691
MNIEGSINQISGLVSKQLKIADVSIKTTSIEHIDWNQIKRTPQYLKQKMKYGNDSFTIDEEFDDLEQNLNLLNKKIISLSKYHRSFEQIITTINNQSETIATLFKDFFDPYKSISTCSETDNKVFEQECAKWQNLTYYIENNKKLLPSFKSEMELLNFGFRCCMVILVN